MIPASASHSLMTPETSPAAGHPLGPLVRVAPLRRPLVGRGYALALLLAATAVFVAAWRIDPGEARMGTHRQLGLPPCGFLVITGLPCPTCGMTTAFAHAVRGEFLAAIRSQAFGFALALATLAAGAASLTTLITGRKLTINWYRIDPVRLVWWTAATFVLGWAIKIGLGLLDGTLPSIRQA